MANARGYTANFPADQKFRGQAALIVAVMSAVPMTTAAIASVIKEGLVTRQDPERVVAFYMSVWKKKGWVRVTDVTVPESEARTSSAAEAAPASVQDEVGGLHADDHVNASMEANVESVASLPDLKGRKLSEGVLEVLKFKGTGLDASGITAILNSNGYDFKENQVQSALGNLERKGSIVRKDDGVFETVAA